MTMNAISALSGRHRCRVAGILVPNAVTLLLTGLLAGRRPGAPAPSRSPRNELGIAVVSVASWARVFAETAVVAVLAGAGRLDSIARGIP